MVLSMTGYGRMVKEFERSVITVEIRSLNSKYVDVKLKLPQSYREREMTLRKKIADRLKRGKVDVLVEVKSLNGNDEFVLNRSVFINYYNEIKSIREELNAQEEDLMASIVRLPNVVVATQETIDEDAWENALEVLGKALDKITKFRQDEGNVLKEDLELRVKNIMTYLEQIVPFEKERIEKLRARLKQNMEDFGAKGAVDENRFEQEVMYYIEKMDITEEKVRLAQHCKYFSQELANKRSTKGKKLNFISQEIGREINTIGSKANSSAIQRLVVQMKDELEKIKEQVANIV